MRDSFSLSGVKSEIDRVSNELMARIQSMENAEMTDMKDTPVEIRQKLESLKDDDRLDISAIKGVEKSNTTLSDSIINRAIGIVDQRTSFLINKTSSLQTEVRTKVTGIGTTQITISATAPSNPSVNDLWYDIS